MYARIMVPVDLAHRDKLTKAFDTAIMLGRQAGALLIYTGVTTTAPSAVAASPEEYERTLAAFVDEQARLDGVPAEAHTIRSHDLSIDLTDKLVAASKDLGADLIVMASHVPGIADHVFHSNAGHVATRAPVSVFVVR